MKRLCSIVILSLLIMLAGCRRQAEQSIPEVQPVDNFGDKLVIGALAEPLNLIPLLATDANSLEIARLIYSGLVEYVPGQGIKGILAESFDISDDNKTIRFNLRQDAFWHDGVRFTADDVIFTYNFILSLGASNIYYADFSKISAISAPDEFTVYVEYAAVNPSAFIGWTAEIMPKHLMEGVAAAKSNLQKNPVGTGAYKFRSWEQGQSLILDANLDYFGGRPNIAEIEYKYFSARENAYAAMLRGDIDMLRLTPAQYDAYTGVDFMKYRYEEPYYSYIGYNTNRAPFSNKVVRQALGQAVNRQAIVAKVLLNKGRVVDSPYPADSVWHNDGISSLAYDYEGALKLLEGAGYKRNNAGKLTFGGKVAKISILTNKNPARIQAAEMIKDNWEALGFEVELTTLDWAPFLSALARGSFDVAILEMNSSPDPDLTEIWHSSMCKAPNGLNFTCFQNAEADRLLESGASESDFEKRRAYYYRLQEILAEEQPVTFLYTEDALWAVSSRFKGIEPSRAGMMHNIESWYAPRDEQKYRQDSGGALSEESVLSAEPETGDTAQ